MFRHFYLLISIFFIIKICLYNVIDASNFTMMLPKTATLSNYGFDGRHVTWYFQLKTCGSYHLYDKVANKCRPVYCRLTSNVLVYRKCGVTEAFTKFFDHEEFIDIQIENWSIELNIHLINGTLDRTKKTSKRFENLIAKNLAISDERIEVTNLILLRENYFEIKLKVFEEVAITVSNQKIVEELLRWVEERKILEIDGNFIMFTKLSYGTIGLMPSVRSFCDGASVRQIAQWGMNFSIISSNKLRNNENGRVYPKGSYMATVLVLNDLPEVITFTLLCEKVSGLLCETFKLPADSYEFINNGSHIKSIHGVTNKFEVDTNSIVKICEPARFFWITNNAENTIATVFLVISCVFLVLILVTFAKVPDILKTLPGFNTINLVLTILILQLLFLIGSQWENCWLAGILIHYFILLNFSWSSIIGFHIFRTFVVAEFIHYTESSKIRSRITSFVIAHSMVIIVIFIALINEYTANDFAPHFGPFQGVCWIRSSIGVLLYFAIPLSLSNSMNFLFYLASHIRIKRTLQQSFAFSTRSNARIMPTQLTVFSRIAAVLSISWLSILMIPLTPPKSIFHESAKYLFVFVNTNQGFLLFLAFLWNRRVAQIWMNWARIIFHGNLNNLKNSITTISASFWAYNINIFD